jgi:hypothetical protein
MNSNHGFLQKSLKPDLYASHTARPNIAKLLLTLFLLSLTPAEKHSAFAGEYFPFLFQRAIYLDHLTMDGGWWANPAIPADLNAPFLHTANVLPLGDSLLISGVRMFLPVTDRLVAGGGILGAGGYKKGSSSSSAGSGGFTHTSSFAFERPRIQLGAAMRIPFVGSAGILGTIGSDLKSTGTYSQKAITPGMGLGWLSPELMNSIQFSYAMMFIHHSLEYSFWENSGKLGIRFSALDSVLQGSFEYTFSFGRFAQGFGVFTQDRDGIGYDALKGLVSFQLYRNLAATGGRLSAGRSTARERRDAG